MDSSSAEVSHDFHPFFRVYKNGRIERLRDSGFAPSSDDPKTGVVRSKDVTISHEPKVSARLFLPKTTNPYHRLPLLIYIHGGAFSVESAFSNLYHNYLNSLVAEANVIAVSIDYRLAPEHPVPACYDDSWIVLRWVSLHASNEGPDPWLNDHADFGRVFLAGDSAGANISHNMVVRIDAHGLEGLKIEGMVLVHPYFGNNKPAPLWTFICPETSGLDDPRLNPSAHPGLLANLGCNKVLICTASKDHLSERGWTYYEALRKSGWGGVMEMMEIEGEDHIFHLFNPTCEKAIVMMKRVTSFINQDKPAVPSSL